MAIGPRIQFAKRGQDRGLSVLGARLAKRRIEIGLLYSRSGTYTLIAEACRTGALSAIAEINADPDCDVTFIPVERDPGGNIDHYGPLCEEILSQTSARHIIGCVTSWSRKEVIPVLERSGGTLWYTVPYEGFEASDHVVYTHACPNQHLIPLLDWALSRHGRRVYLTGSNYIWGWEMNRLTREIVSGAGGEILGERYLPIGGLEIGRIVDEIEATRPDFVMNSLIGASQYQFIAALRDLGLSDERFAPENCPVLSCNLTECELPALGAAGEGLVAAGPYFRGSTSWPGGGSFGSSHEAATAAAVHALARLLAGRPGAEYESLSSLLASPTAGACNIDPKTHHSTLPVLIARVQSGQFRIIEECGLVAGDPYLTRDRSQATAPEGRTLRVVK